MGPASRRRRRWFAAAAAVLGLGVGLLICELGLRLLFIHQFRRAIDETPDRVPNDPDADLRFGELLYRVGNPELVYAFKPHAMGRFVGARVELNSRGFRDAEPSPRADDKTIRIVGVGDSTMFGWGVEVGERYLTRLDAALREAVGPDWTLQTINLGAPSYNAAQEVELFHRQLDWLDPDAVVIHYDQNDSRLAPFLYHRKLFFKGRWRLLDVLGAFDGSAVYEEFWELDRAELPEEHAHLNGPESVDRAYRRLAETCRERGVPVVVVLPFWGYSGAVECSEIAEQLRPVVGLFSELGMTVVETCPEMARFAEVNGMNVTDLLIDYPIDMHPTAAAHGILSRTVFPAALRAIAPGRLDEARVEEALARHAAESLDDRIEHGLYPSENWDGVEVRWSDAKARRFFEPDGRTLVVSYYVGHRDVSRDRPIEVRFRLENLEEVVVRHEARGLFERRFDLTGLGAGPLALTIRVEPTFTDRPDGSGRTLGVALYPLRFEGGPSAAAQGPPPESR
jgi:hypothetical protein